MDNIDFKANPPYQIVEHLYNSKKNFIILGVCGKIGSGVTETANILTKQFEELFLPVPSYDNNNIFLSHEYRILYTYASRNWKQFYKIRVSALITRCILTYGRQDFLSLLNEFNENKESFEPEVTSFFDKCMHISLNEMLKELNSDIREGLINDPKYLLEKDEDLDQLKEGKSKNSGEKSYILENNELQFEYDIESKSFVINNVTLAKFFDNFSENREKKKEFRNPFLYIVLKKYLYDLLPIWCDELWDAIQSKSKRLPFSILQYLGNNLRMYEVPFFNKTCTFRKEGYVFIAEQINLTIKVLRAYNKILQLKSSDEADIKIFPSPKSDNKTIIVIDSIKNPYESMYLKTRYSSYYLVGIYTEDEERKRRLRYNKHLTDNDIDDLDLIEENSRLKDALKKWSEGKTTERSYSPIIKKLYEQFKENNLIKKIPYILPFAIQNVSSCLETADILINNEFDTSSFNKLKLILLRYVSLIMNPGIVLPTDVERCMQIAYTAKLNSGCISRQVGAVLTDKDYHLLSIGWNQQPEGQLPCLYHDLCEVHHHWIPDGYSDYENDDNDDFQKSIKEQVEMFFDTNKSPLKEIGKFPQFCFKDYFNDIKHERNQVHTRALHAEETAFLNLGPNNFRAKDGILFTTSSPCELCAKKAMYMGISKIYYVEPYAGVSHKHVLGIGKKESRPELILFTGAIGTAYTKLYSSLLPHKDELEMWLGAKMNTHLLEELKEFEDSTNGFCIERNKTVFRLLKEN